MWKSKAQKKKKEYYKITYYQRLVENQRHATEYCIAVLVKLSDALPVLQNQEQENKVISSTFETNTNNWSANILLLNQMIRNNYGTLILLSICEILIVFTSHLHPHLQALNFTNSNPG